MTSASCPIESTAGGHRLSSQRPGSPRRQAGGTAVGFLVGVVAGLLVAAIAALLATRAPLPLINKSDQVNAIKVAPQAGQTPDPNRPLFREEQAEQAKADPSAQQETDSDAAPIISAAPRTAPGASTVYLLQAGAFRVQADAESMRGQLTLMGFEPRVAAAQINNEILYRVRIGPYKALDSMNIARARLADNGIEASVVRQ